MKEIKEYKFPEGFLWGSSTSAHQVEGNNHNDWSEWEKKNAKRLAKEAGSYWQAWQQDQFPEMFDEKNYISGRAADHYNLYEKDFDILEELNQDAFRLSIEWSRIEPEEGKFEQEAIKHYQDVIASLKKRNIEPFVTLWHWSFPLWMAKKGGFEKQENIKNFTKYTEVMTKALPDVKFWITLNEPEVYALHSYFKKNWPPQKKSYFLYRKVIRNLVEAHKEAYKAIKKHNPDSKICVAKHNIFFEAHEGKIVNKVLKYFADLWWNDWFLKKIEGYQDIISLNNYHHNRINYGFNKNKNKKVSDFGWELYPESLSFVARELSRYNLPIYITEHGLADAKDEKREFFLKESLKHLQIAIREGVDVRGYLHWSFCDNFEWDKGFWLKFGLVEVDFKTQKRTIRKSAYEYAKICKNNKLFL